MPKVKPNSETFSTSKQRGKYQYKKINLKINPAEKQDVPDVGKIMQVKTDVPRVN